MRTLPIVIRVMICNLLILPVISMLSLQAQDYNITFPGSGASTTVDSIIVENLTRGTKLKKKGSDVMHLMGTTGMGSGGQLLSS